MGSKDGSDVLECKLGSVLGEKVLSSKVGLKVGNSDGGCVLSKVGNSVANSDGDSVSDSVGNSVGNSDGGWVLSSKVGSNVGWSRRIFGSLVGLYVGCNK